MTTRPALVDQRPPGRHLEAVAIDVARLAAGLVREQVGRAAATGTKSTLTDVVTETDVRSETLIRRELLERCPGSSIVGEELSDERGTNRVGWVVDPIDGTVNFLYDLPVVSVSIAATLHGQTVAGAVVDVVRDEVFSASTESGARRNGEPMSASLATDLEQALVGTGFAYDAIRRREQTGIVSRVLPTCRDIRCMGSAALNLCWVGCGRLDAYYEQDTKPYDYAAGAFIAREAGATVELPRDNALDMTIAAGSAVFTPFRQLVAGE
ncbi:MAG: inositol monophosphatase family protein [Ilumatobacter sp.]